MVGDMYSNILQDDNDYEENQERVNTDLLKKVKKRKLDGYRGV